MPITMRCPGCVTRFEFASDLEGKRIKCKNCGDVFRVERPVRKARDEDDARRGSRSRRDGDDDDRYPSRGRRAVADEEAPRRHRGRDDDESRPRKKVHPMLIAGPIIGVVLIGVVVLIIVSSRGKKGTPGTPGETGDVVKAPLKTCPLDVTESQTGFLVLPDAGGTFGLLRRTESNPTKKSWAFEPYDLTSGRRVGRVNLTNVDEPKGWSLSPDGKHLLITETKGLGWAGDHTLHLISTADGKDIDWKPFPKDEKRPFDSPSLYRAEMVSNDRVLALGTNRRIYMYQLANLSEPSQHQIDAIGEPLGKEWGPRPDNVERIQWQVAFSADRRQMAVWNGDGYSIVDTASGDELNRTASAMVMAKEYRIRESVGRGDLRAGPVAFSPDGSVLAGVITVDRGSKLHVLCFWDTKESKPPATHHIPSNQYNDATTIRWWGKKYILMSGAKVHGKEIDGMLVDSLTGVAVKQLMAPEYKHYGLGRDGRLWYAAGTERKDPALMYVVDGPTTELMEDAANPYEQIPELKDSFLRRLWMEPAGVMWKPTRYNPPLQQGLIRRP
jgi:hypothetical protein